MKGYYRYLGFLNAFSNYHLIVVAKLIISFFQFWNSIISPSYENDEILHNWQTKVISKIVESRIQKLVSLR